MAQNSDRPLENNGRPSPKSRLAMLKRTKKASNASSDPFRFQNNGVSYKGKLIGEQDVDKARGDAMCAEAMRTAKCIVKAMGSHKTRISLQINIDGIKILEERTGTILHSFPVSRISFIARDSSDARAFGLVYGEPEGRYKFYGIKTAQAADQAVLAIRDMFQVVFEMKKKHIEQVKQQQDQDGSAERSFQAVKEGDVAVADLLDLESELEKIEQGCQQLSTVPCDAFGATPFGDQLIDSFNTTATSNGTMNHSQNVSQNISNLSGGQDPFGAAPMAQMPPVQQPAQNWPGSFDLLGLQPPMHHAHSTPAFGGYSDTNPFSSAAPLLPTVAAPYRDPFSVGPSLPSSTIDWNGGAGATSEPSIHHANTYSNFGSKFNGSWKEKKVTSLEDAFTKLVDLDSMVGDHGAKGMKKNPFEHILNPPKASLNSMSSTCSAAQMAATQSPITAAPSHVDPFGDFFR